MLIACIYDLASGHARAILDGKVTESVLGIFYGVMLLAVFLAYQIKSKYNKKHEHDE